MTDEPKPAPPIRRRQLGYRLGELRDLAGMTQDDAVKETGLSRSTISQIENAERAILEKNVRLLASAYGVQSPELDMLLRMARESNKRGLLVAHADVAANFARDYMELESYATEVWTLETAFVAGLLQVPSYVRAVRLISKPDATEAELQSAVDLRVQRQERLTGTDPLRLRVLLDESLFDRVVGGADVVAEQAAHLIEMSELDNITIQVVPKEAGPYRGMGYSFSVLRFEPTPGMDVAYAEGWLSATYYEKRREVRAHADLFEQIAAAALSPQATRDRLATLGALRSGN
ncbi:transcriptional regulator with XRE-family HTH domain [Saccharothrix tamanrassetensis]|uniref:Transcriptional regulator with XRE-family HTH domain n=1 Tax=Saccharothrix tamanrassetensis TaxID=1051531 RepID=A0A841CK87_9PSEU|nr:helix-turn-helix transcriptional regulator [Saccharothrix tamanrassetensis]MBB5956507.1 transcriptional regulator with XRE-family HTH domain [Saccharothrix tamanrassetensis]